VVNSAAFNAKCTGGDFVGILCVANDRRKKLKGRDVGCDVVTAIHRMLIMLRSRFVKVDDRLRING